MRCCAGVVKCRYPYVRQQAIHAVTGLSLSDAVELVKNARVLEAEMKQHSASHTAATAATVAANSATATVAV